MPDGIPAGGSQRIISNHGVLKDFNGLIRHYVRPYVVFYHIYVLFGMSMCFLVFWLLSGILVLSSIYMDRQHGQMGHCNRR